MNKRVSLLACLTSSLLLLGACQTNGSNSSVAQSQFVLTADCTTYTGLMEFHGRVKSGSPISSYSLVECPDGRIMVPGGDQPTNVVVTDDHISYKQNTSRSTYNVSLYRRPGGLLEGGGTLETIYGNYSISINLKKA